VNETDQGRPQDLNAAKAGRSLRNGLISLVLLLALMAGLLLAIPGLNGVADKVSDMNGWWIGAGVALEILSCLGYVLAFLQVFDRAPGGSACSSDCPDLMIRCSASCRRRSAWSCSHCSCSCRATPTAWRPECGPDGSAPC
jgi:hypothetical protein